MGDRWWRDFRDWCRLFLLTNINPRLRWIVTHWIGNWTFDNIHIID